MTSILKSLADFLEPPGLLWLVLTVMTFVPLWRRKSRAALLPGTAWLLLTLTAASPLSPMLMGWLESRWPPVRLEELPQCDAVVVLGGGLEPSEREPAEMHLMGGSDRLFAALAVARAGKARVLVIGGGRTVNGHPSGSESAGARAWVERWQLTTVPVQVLGACVDTHDEAVKVAALCRENGWKKVAVVTSAFHMTRTNAVFVKAGVPVHPVPCDYQSPRMRGVPLRWLHVPNNSNLAHFETWLHEMIGLCVYRLRGWI